MALKICRAWLGDPNHFYREWAAVLVEDSTPVKASVRSLSLALRTLMTESEKFGEDPGNVSLREAQLTRDKKGLTKALAGREGAKAVFRRRGTRFELAGAADPLLPTPSDGP